MEVNLNLFCEMVKREAIRGDYKQAAISLVCSQVEARSPCAVWKWWKRSFGRKENYLQMTRCMVEAILQEFHTGGELFRQTVARIFGKGKAAGNLPVNEFIDVIRRKKVRDYPLPENFVASSPPPTLRRVAKTYRYPKFPIRQNGSIVIDLRKDVVEMRRLLAKLVGFYVAEARTSRQMPAVCAIEVGFYLCQAGWVVIHFDTRPRHKRDGDWTSFCKQETVRIPQWKKGHDLAQADGGTFILPDGKKLEVKAGISCNRLAAIYGGMIKTVLLDAKKAGQFKELPMREHCQLDVEEFDGMWAWPGLDQMGRVNLA